MRETFASNVGRLADLIALIAASGPWDGAKIRLYKNNVEPDPSMELADFEQADFTGYGDSSDIVWGTPFFKTDGSACVTSDLKVFTVGSTPTVFNTLYGYVVLDDAGTGWIFGRKFDTPIVLSGAGQAVEVLASSPSYAAP